MKKCTSCKANKELVYFSKDSSRGSGLAASCKECVSARRNQHYQENKISTLAKNKAWKIANKDRVRSADKNREQFRFDNDINFRLKKLLRNRINSAIKKNIKTGSAISDLGCSVDFLKSYLESKFEPGMSWDNHGQYGWHIDHIVPLDSFNLSDREEFLKACNYTNLQPLWALDNLKKSNKAA